MDEQMIKYNKFGWVDLSELARNKNGTINWKGSVGQKIHFKYRDVESDIILLEYIAEHSSKIRIVDYVDEYIINHHNISKGRLGRALNKITSEFRYKVGDIVNNNLLLTSAYIKNGHRNYTYTCLIDGYNGNTLERHIIQGHGCPVCAGHIILKGVNDISTVRPDMIDLFWNPDDAYIYGQYSNKKSDFRCPRCGNKINAWIDKVSIYGLSCKKCGDHISYPEKFVFNFLQQVGILHKENTLLQKFEPQKMFSWSKGVSHQNPKLSGDKKYDFYIPLYNEIIIEVHGEQHFKNCFFHTYKNTKNLEEERENDKLKMNLAISNGILSQNYIQLDCRYSNAEYIKNSIMSSSLPLLFNFKEDQINWDMCNNFATSSRIYEACELWNNGNHVVKDIASVMKMSRTTITKYLRRGFELGILQDPPKYLLNSTAQNYL